MDNQQPSTSRGYYGREGGARSMRTNWNGQGGQRGQDLQEDPPPVPILDYIKVLSDIKPVFGFEGSYATFEFETNCDFDVRKFVLIQWYVGRSTFKGYHRDTKTHRGTKHTLRTLLDLSMNGAVLVSMYCATDNGLIFEYILWSSCRVIPQEDYAKISREYSVSPCGRFSSLSAFIRRSRSKTTDENRSKRASSQSPKKRNEREKKYTSQEYARAIRMPHGSFGLYENRPNDLYGEPKRYIINYTCCCHNTQTKNYKLRKSNSQTELSTSGTNEVPQHPNRPEQPDIRNSPRRLLPVVPWRHRLQRQQPQAVYINNSAAGQRKPEAERMSRQRQRGRHPAEPHSDSPPARQPLLYPPMEQRRYRSLSPQVLQTTVSVGTQTPLKGRLFCDCWKRAKCETCAEQGHILTSILRRGKKIYCSCFLVWVNFSVGYTHISDGIQKMNRENR